ncbi:hypothetical protein EHF33_20925 (plasmid) [Deinococcus psychrotolerans]|uniref:Uncharacterized protein n=1 Tax=Deinococcus psychrotolerans TaxID=2489213 RepID=A0A3G8YW32_9DEIO|nr:hypothetical protein [Deinococcus psychrotolerans]AZI45376.1 hypothetical protein EHF33_20925 [Deinococcus psychrotolerans]
MSLSACSTDTKPQALTSALTVKLDGVTQANLTLKNASDKVVFDGLIEQEKVIRDLPRDVYTLTGAAVDTRVAQMRIVDLRQGDQSATVSYVEQRAQLILQVYGVAQAPITVRDEKGVVVFDGPVMATQNIPTLSYGTYTITPGTVSGQTTPSVQTVRVNGATTVTINYVSARSLP